MWVYECAWVYVGGWVGLYECVWVYECVCSGENSLRKQSQCFNKHEHTEFLSVLLNL